MPVYDKPMIYYPLSTLMMAGIREILVITTPDDQAQFQRLLGDGSQLGLRHRVRHASRAPRASRRRSSSAPTSSATSRSRWSSATTSSTARAWAGSSADTATSIGGHVFAYHVANPQEYGVVEFDDDGRVLSIEEKPAAARSPATPCRACTSTTTTSSRSPRELKPERPRRAGDHRGQRRRTCEPGRLHGRPCWTAAPPGWTPAPSTSLMQAAEFVQVVEERQGLKIGCIEEVAWRDGFIDDAQLRALAEPLRKSGYGDYLLGLLAEDDDGGPDGDPRAGHRGRLEITPQQHGDRGASSWSGSASTRSPRRSATRCDLAQANISVSARGMVRGIHFADVPPARPSTSPACGARCSTSSSTSGSARRPSAAGRRSGSTTTTAGRVYLAEGLGHVFCALTDDATSSTSAPRPTTRPASTPCTRSTRRWASSGPPTSSRSCPPRTRRPARGGPRAGMLPVYDSCRRFVASLGPDGMSHSTGM